MSDRRLVTVFLIGCGVVCLIFLLKGFSVEDNWFFDGRPSQNIGGGVTVSLWVDAREESLGILGVSFYSKSHGPYSLRFAFYTNAATVDLTSVTVDRATLRYSDGTTNEVVAPGQKRSWGFSAHRYSNWTSNGIVYHDLCRAGGTLTNCVAKNEAFVVECRGRVERASGEDMPFNVQWSFRPRRVSGVFSGWHFERPFHPP